MPYRFNYGTIESYRNHTNLLREIYGLRYQVYVNEWGFEIPEDHPEGLEYDDYDDSAVHIYACSNADPENRIIGTVRLVLNSPLGFPIEKHFDLSHKVSGVDRNALGEISRLAVSKEYRRRAIDRTIFGAEKIMTSHIPRYIDSGRDIRRHCEHELVRGLYIALYRDSKLRELTHWYAVMAKGLYTILKRWGITFEQIGPARDYHGIRAPYLVSIESIERSMARIDPALYCDARSGLLH